MAEAKPNLQFNINPSICKHGDQQYLSMEPQITRITLIFNHEWTRMNTNWEQSTEYTEETEASPQEPTNSEEFRCVYEILCRENSNGCLRLGGSSRFAQAQKLSCESSSRKEVILPHAFVFAFSFQLSAFGFPKAMPLDVPCDRLP